MIDGLVQTLYSEACRANERRLVALSGSRHSGVETVATALETIEIPAEKRVFVSDRDEFQGRCVRPADTDELMGQTWPAIIVDCHDRFEPNVLARVVGAVDGGGILFLLVPDLDEWPDRRDDFDETVTAPPASVEDVTGRFRQRVVETLRTHGGVAVVDVDAGEIHSRGTTRPSESTRHDTPDSSLSARSSLPETVYDQCLTADQARAVRALDGLTEDDTAVTLESDRGRGKSSAAGLAAGAMAARGADITVTAVSLSSAREVFDRAEETLSRLESLATVRETPAGPDGHDRADNREDGHAEGGYTLETTTGGTLTFESPSTVAERPDAPDVVIVDEAAALPVHLLESFLDARAVAFLTTVHGYEGTGRGFEIRFRDRLIDSRLEVTDIRLSEPIRYADDDPVEKWSFRAFALDATPAVELAVDDAAPETVEYQRLHPSDLLENDHRLRETIGLLALAHYQTEPNDLARMLDAPNLGVRALVVDDHVVAVALLAREGGLPQAMQESIYEGSRITGNMIPDLLTSQLRNPDGAAPTGVRVVRIAVHGSVRCRGLGSHLLGQIHTESADTDWVGTGYGATPRLIRFWRRNGYQTIHLSTTRNDASGEHSAIMLHPMSDRGEALTTRHTRAFRERIRESLSDALREVDPEIVRNALAACEAPPAVSIEARGWRAVVAASYGPGTYEADPGPFRDLAVAALLTDTDLTAADERLLIAKILQGRPWSVVAVNLGFESTGRCKRALGSAYTDLVDRFGAETPLVKRERERFRNS